tara:strand:+ start:26383 stop:28020 length:1638 start_codon:yes stop_codon:yes gene_type:complete
MKLKYSTSGLLLLVLGLSISSAQASYNHSCDYDLREGAFFYNANNPPTDGNGNAQQNELLVFLRNADGTLSSDIQTHRVNSGGYGNQAGIVTSGQNAVYHTGEGDDQYVLMINAGFNPVAKPRVLGYGKHWNKKRVDKNGSVSAFKVNKCNVVRTSVRSTRGQEPRAVTRHKNLVYVVNAGSGEVEFNGCPGLPEGFLPPTGQVCGERAPIAEDDQDAQSIIGYRFRNGRLRYIRGSNINSADSDGDPVQLSFINEGRQLLVANRNTFFALGDGTEADEIEVHNIDKRGRPSYPVVSTTTGNDNFGFSVYPRDGKDYNDCVMMTHGSFQQRDQGGASVFTINKWAEKVRIIPNKADGGSDTCWTAVSRTNTLYTSAFFDSEISIRGINPDTCNLTDGGPPVVVVDGVPQFTGPLANIRHRVSSSGANFDGSPRGGDISLRTDQRDFLYEAGGLDLAISKYGKDEYLYAIWAPVPFYVDRDGDGNFLYPPTTQVTVFRVIQDCNDTLGTGLDGAGKQYEDGCRVGDLELVQRVPGLPGSGYGAAAQ